MPQNLPKQVIVVRTDLVMPMGKLGAQISHASEAPVYNQMTKSGDVRTLITKEGSALQLWLDGPFVKIILGCKSLDKLLKLAEDVKARNIPVAIIKDAGYTVFTEPTITCIGIGPCFPEEIDDLTKRFQTLKSYKFE
ncbi:MAG: aminoacyl-tRNA hydrolase [Candidatus Pacearchaeota archaeon]|jgi:PTH2 family peptidyl-tRNA hydrolase|nr:peptidyl-tRNA hydrolase [Clostridia bacterium]